MFIKVDLDSWLEIKDPYELIISIFSPPKRPLYLYHNFGLHNRLVNKKVSDIRIGA